MKGFRLALAGASILAMGSIAPAHAASASVCTFTSHVTITPGVTATPAPGTFVSSNGVITCNGSITGTGTVAYQGVAGPAGESCVADAGGGGAFSYAIGTFANSGTFTFGRAAVAGGFQGTFSDGSTIAGTFEFSPTQGDCVSSPITEADVTGQAVIVRATAY